MLRLFFILIRIKNFLDLSAETETCCCNKSEKLCGYHSFLLQVPLVLFSFAEAGEMVPPGKAPALVW
jgi:hypothetical protein